MKMLHRSLAAIVALSACLPVVHAEHVVTTLSKETYRGEIVEITDKQVVVQTADGSEKRIPLAKVLIIHLQKSKVRPSDQPYHLLLLYDESKLLCREIAFGPKSVHVTLLSGQKLEVPIEAVRGFLREANDKERLAVFEKLARTVSKDDHVFVVRNGVLNPIPGALGEIDAKGESVKFQIPGGNVINAKFAKMQGALWYRVKLPFKSPTCVVVDVMGNLVGATKIVTKEGRFVVSLPYGGSLAYSPDDLATLDYNRGKLVYLSDLQPRDEVYRSNIGLVVKYKKDSNLDGREIYLGGVKYDRGLSMHAHTELEYDLNGKYKEFKALLGYDRRIGTAESKAVVVIRCDGVEVFRQQVGPEPTPINLNVRNVQRMRIIVQSSNLFDLHDHATLADARLIQKE